MISRVGVGIIGFGTVGTGVAKILLENAALISRRVGVPIEIVRIGDIEVTRDRGLTLPPGLLTTDAKQILADPVVREKIVHGSDWPILPVPPTFSLGIGASWTIGSSGACGPSPCQTRR